MVAGTSSILAGQTVTAHFGPVTGPLIGTAIVDAAGVAGAFQVKASRKPALRDDETHRSGL